MVTALIMAIPYTERPIHLVVADRQGTFFAMSIFNMQEGKLKPGDYITALSPYLRYCSLPPAALDAGKRERDRETAIERQRDSDSSLWVGADSERREGKSGYVCGGGGDKGVDTENGGSMAGCSYRCVQLATGQVLHNGRPCDLSYYERPRAVFTVNPSTTRSTSASVAALAAAQDSPGGRETCTKNNSNAHAPVRSAS
jgi:hypothetical protein